MTGMFYVRLRQGVVEHYIIGENNIHGGGGLNVD